MRWPFASKLVTLFGRMGLFPDKVSLCETSFDTGIVETFSCAAFQTHLLMRPYYYCSIDATCTFFNSVGAHLCPR